MLKAKIPAEEGTVDVRSFIKQGYTDCLSLEFSGSYPHRAESSSGESHKTISS